MTRFTLQEKMLPKSDFLYSHVTQICLSDDSVNRINHMESDLSILILPLPYVLNLIKVRCCALQLLHHSRSVVLNPRPVTNPYAAHHAEHN